MSGPHFDRIVPLITLVLAGLGLVFLLDLNTEALVINLGANIPPFSIAWALIAAIALITGIGVELVARSQPRLHTSGWLSRVRIGGRAVELALPLWIVPMLTPVAIFAFFRLFKGAVATNAYLLVLLATGAILFVVLIAQHYLIQARADRRGNARIVLTVIAYVLMFAIFSAVTFNRYRTLYAIALVFPSALLLAADILRGHVPALWITSAAIGFAIIQCYWALNYWPVPFWFNSVALLIVFYVLIGLGQSAKQHGGTAYLARNAFLEYGGVAAIALVSLALAALWLAGQPEDLRLP